MSLKELRYTFESEWRLLDSQWRGLQPLWQDANQREFAQQHYDVIETELFRFHEELLYLQETIDQIKQQIVLPR